MKRAMQVLFTAILLAMLWITITASMQRGLFVAFDDLWPDLWFRATLADAYFGFLAVFCWIAYREATWVSRAVWFVLLMLLGNIAIAVYFLVELARLPGNDVGPLFERKRRS